METNKKTLLLVDDNLEIGARLGKLLLLEGYNSRYASSGKEAVRIYRESKEVIDIVVLDLVMPDMNGVEVFEALKEMNPDVKVLIASGNIADGTIKQMLDAGALGFVRKPYLFEEITKEVNRILEISKRK